MLRVDKRRGRVKNLGKILKFIYFLTKEQKCNCTITMECRNNLWGARRSSPFHSLNIVVKVYG